MYVYNCLVYDTTVRSFFQVVKLKVLRAPTENKPPVAVIKPAGKVSFKLPADFSLNGIDSHDDDKVCTQFTVTRMFYFSLHIVLQYPP